MLKILIVDDETPIREWIAFCIRQMPEKHEIVGLAANGEEALELCKSQMVDVVFTDIRMPRMDGIVLMKHVKAINPNCFIVILTCHSDFEYARCAVKQGVFEYLLKTEIEESGIANVINRIEDRRKVIHTDDDTGTYSLQLKKDVFLRKIISNEKKIEVTEKLLHKEGIFLKDAPVFAIAVKHNENEEIFSKLGMFSAQINHINVGYTCWFSYEKDISLLLGNIVNNPSFLYQINILKEYAVLVKEYLNCSIGLSHIHYDMKKIDLAIKESILSLSREFYFGENGIHTLEAPIQNIALQQEIKKLKEQLFEMMDKKEKVEACALLKRMLSNFQHAQYPDVRYVKKQCIEILQYAYKKVLYTIDFSGSVPTNYADEIYDFRFFEEMRDWVLSHFNELIKSKEDNSTENSFVIAQAKEFIKKHCTETIGLADVASHVNLNPEYLSRLFKEKTGMNYINYLIHLRMDKAIELLRNSSMKIYEIAETIGYPNLSYFSSTFKKHVGISPFEYRNKLQD